jgi:hypothetical protein
VHEEVASDEDENKLPFFNFPIVFMLSSLWATIGILLSIVFKSGPFKTRVPDFDRISFL